ncbi:hypothetical protein DTO271G3_2054 [Paecilomyces variotii]|nr:hypothetical protein DTO271G3_2054 [Paecilomyces variotii]
MSAVTITNNPPAPAEPKGAKKKRARSSGSNNVSNAAPASIPDTPSTPTESVNGATDTFESAVMRDLQKSLRNAVKKLNSTSKVDSIIAENPGKSLDELVAEKKINQDQKAQALKKPALQANVAQLEEQIAQYKQFASHYEERLANQKSSLEKVHKEELDAVREKVLAEAAESNKKGFRDQLLVLSKFLRAAAAMRRAGDETSAESRAFEGVLFQVYGGTDEAVDSMLKLIEGVEENIISVEGEALEVSYGKVKQASEEYAPAPVEGAWTEEAPAAETTPASDPTLANAGATELQDSSVAVQSATSSGFADSAASQPEQTSAAPPQTIAEDGANAQAHSWDPQASDSLAASTNADGWVEVPRDPTETDTGIQNTPAAVHGSNNWAEDVPKPTAAPAKGEGDGFEPVVHHQRQPSQRGRGRGRGRGDGFRGRGGRGEFRGRGRGRGEVRGGRGRGGFGGQQNSNGSTAPIAAQ